MLPNAGFTTSYFKLILLEWSDSKCEPAGSLFLLEPIIILTIHISRTSSTLSVDTILKSSSTWVHKSCFLLFLFLHHPQVVECHLPLVVGSVCNAPHYRTLLLFGGCVGVIIAVVISCNNNNTNNTLIIH